MLFDSKCDAHRASTQTTLRAEKANLERYISAARKSIRLEHLFPVFAKIANGDAGVPLHVVRYNPDLFDRDPAILAYAEHREIFAGPFNRHFVASLPYVLEEQSRMGSALLTYLLEISIREDRPARLYTLGDGAGVTARTVTSMAMGRIISLNCSPNPENAIEFASNCPEGAHFFLGPFWELTPEKLTQIAQSVFRDGFDVIVEDTTFQMYGKEREEPLSLALRHLKENGILIAIEKFMHPLHDEFCAREAQKDNDFKSHHFTQDQINEKRSTILKKMDRQLVTLDQFAVALSRFFEHGVVTWNSGNFSTVASSNAGENLSRLVELLGKPAIPANFLYGQIPRDLGLKALKAATR